MFPTLSHVDKLELNSPTWSIKTYVYTSTETGVMIIPGTLFLQTTAIQGAEFCSIALLRASSESTVGIRHITVLIAQTTSIWERLADAAGRNNIITGYRDGPWWVVNRQSDLLTNIQKGKIDALVRAIYDFYPENFEGRSKATIRLHVPEQRALSRFQYRAVDFGFNYPNPDDCS